MHVAAVSLAVNFTAAMLLTPAWGALGAAWAAVLGGVTACGCYCLFSLTRRELQELLLVSLKVTTAVAGLSLVLLMAPGGRGVLGAVLGVSLYLLLLVTLRVVKPTDLHAFHGRFAASGE
jgi:hypothetical protein